VSELPEVEIIARLIALSARYGIEELEAEEAGLKVSLTASFPNGDEEGLNGGAYRLSSFLPSWPDAEGKAASGTGRPETARALAAPLTGTFYAAKSPEDPPFAEVGRQVAEGETVGLIEAMKVFSEVPAEFAGTIVEIVAQNGKLVQRGEVLMYIDPA
jgi:biotin carboxyl carrier protein